MVLSFQINYYKGDKTLTAHKTLSGMPVKIIGHRGAIGLYPENTLPGFAMAIGLGVDII